MPQPPYHQPQNLKHHRPDSGLVGWAAAWGQLDRIESDRQRDTLTAIVRGLGVQGAPALDYAARCAMWLTGLRSDPPTARAVLGASDQEFVERRLRVELASVDAKQFPKLKKL